MGLVWDSPRTHLCCPQAPHSTRSPIVNIEIKFLTPPIPHASATHICETYLGKLDWYHSGSRTGVDLAREGTWHQGRGREEDAEGGETEAAPTVSDVGRRLDCRLSAVNT